MRKYIGEFVGLLAGIFVLLPHFLADLLTHMQKMEVSSTEKTVEEEDRVTELPEIPQLQHLAKNRPKRPKKHASSKNVVKVREGWVENNKILDATTFQLAEGEADDIKDGLDNFCVCFCPHH